MGKGQRLAKQDTYYYTEVGWLSCNATMPPNAHLVWQRPMLATRKARCSAT